MGSKWRTAVKIYGKKVSHNPSDRINHCNIDSEEEISDESEDECHHFWNSKRTVYACMNCAKTVEPAAAAIGMCTTCQTTQELITPRFSAKLFIPLLHWRHMETYSDLKESTSNITVKTFSSPAFTISFIWLRTRVVSSSHRRLLHQVVHDCWTKAARWDGAIAHSSVCGL